MAHENSTTSQNKFTGDWGNFNDKGEVLGPRLNDDGSQVVESESRWYKSKDEAVDSAKLRSESFNTPVVDAATVEVEKERLVHPDENDVGVSFSTWLEYYGKLYPKVDLIHFYETKEIRNKVTESGKNFVNETMSSMESNNTDSIAYNAQAETNFANKTDQQNMVNSPEIAAVIAEEQDKNNFLVPKVGDWNSKEDRLLVEADLYQQDINKDKDNWILTTGWTGLDLIPWRYRAYAHPGGVSEIVEGDDTPTYYNRFEEAKEYGTAYELQTINQVGRQVFGIATDNFHRKQNDLNTLWKQADKEHDRGMKKSIQKALDKNRGIQSIKASEIIDLYNLDSFRMKSGAPAAQRAYFDEQQTINFAKVRDGMAASQDLIDDLSNQLDRKLLLGILSEGSEEYNKIYAQLEFAQGEHYEFSKKYSDIVNNTWNAKLVYGTLWDKNKEVLTHQIPQGILDMSAGFGKGLTESVVNNSWDLVSTTYYALMSDEQRKGDPWRIDAHSDREGVVFDLTAIMTEYMTPFMATRGLMTKVGEVVKDISALAVAGLWMKPEEGNIIHAINSFSNDQLDWLSSMGVEPNIDDPMYKKILMTIVEGTEAFTIELAKLDITPKKGDPAYKKLLQRMSASAQEAALGGIFHGLVWLNRMGGKEIYHAIKEQRKYATLMDRTIESVTGINVFGNRVNRLNTSAKFYQSQGKNPQYIYKRTGYHQDTQGDWHFRGDYTKGTWTNMVEGSRKLDNVVNDKTLYGFVPEARNTNIVFAGERSPGTVGAEYDAETNTIFIYAKNYDSKQVKSKIWHEIQHNIDTIKGFEAGANPKDFHPTLNKLDVEYRKKVVIARQGETPAEQKVVAKIKAGTPLTKKDQKVLNDIDTKVVAIQYERNAIVGTKGRPKNPDDWGSPRDTSQYSRTALKIKLDVAGEQRAKHIEDTWDVPFDDTTVIEYSPTTVHLSDFDITTTSKQQAEVSYTLGKIDAQLKDAGLRPSDLPTNEQEVYALLESDNEHAALLVNKLITDTLADGYNQAVIKVGNKAYGMTHAVNIHMSPSSRCKGKACIFNEPRDILSVIDVIRKIKPKKMTDKHGTETLVYEVMHNGKPAYQAVIKIQQALDSKGKVKRHVRGKKKGQPMQEHTVVTFHPIDGFNEVSVRDILNKIDDRRSVNIQRQQSTDEAEAIIATVSLEPLKVQQRLLSAKIGQTKDPVQRAAIIARVKDINAEIKTNKQSNVKLSILDDLKTVEWNNQVYSKLENFVESLPADTVFNGPEEILLAAQKFGVTREEIAASRFYSGRGWKDGGGYTKGLLQMQVAGRKDRITYRSWLGDEVEANVEDLHFDTGNNGDGTLYVKDVDTGNLINIEENMDSGMYVKIDGNGHVTSAPMEEEEMLADWYTENLNYFMQEDLPEAYLERHLIKKGDEVWEVGENDHLGYQVGFDSNSNVVPIEDAVTRENFPTEAEAMMTINHDKYQGIVHDEMGSNGYQWHVEYRVDGGDVFDNLDDAEGQARQMLFDYHQDDLDGSNGRLWQEYTVVGTHGDQYNLNELTSNYRLDTYNIDKFEARTGDRGTYPPQGHWSELNHETASVEIGAGGYGGFDNKNILAWVRGFDWSGGRTILDELQSDWAQKWSVNDKKVKALLIKHDLGDATPEEINTLISRNKRTWQEAREKQSRQEQNNQEMNHLRDSYIENLKNFSGVKMEGLDEGDIRFNLNAFAAESAESTISALDDALEDFVNTVLTPNGKTLDDFTHLEFRPWLQKKIKGYQKDSGADRGIYIDQGMTSESWLFDLMEKGKTVSRKFSQRMESSSRRRIPTDDEAVAIHKIILDDIVDGKNGIHDLIYNANNRYITTTRLDESWTSVEKARKSWDDISELDEIIPKPPMGETSSYVRVTLLDQLTKAIDNGQKEFGWWDANVQNERWHRLRNTGGQSVTIEGIGVTDEGEWLVRHTDQDGNMVQTVWKRQELVEHLNERQVGEFDTELAKHVGNDDVYGDVFGSIEVQAEMTDSPTSLYMLKKPLKTGSVFDSQYDQVMVNVMNKLLNSKKTGIKMERQLDGIVPEHYWKLEITDEVKDLILGQKHQLYK